MKKSREIRKYFEQNGNENKKDNKIYGMLLKQCSGEKTA